MRRMTGVRRRCGGKRKTAVTLVRQCNEERQKRVIGQNEMLVISEEKKLPSFSYDAYLTLDQQLSEIGDLF